MKAADIEDLYPLTPLQQGMLFHFIGAPASGVYFEQFTATFDGPLDTSVFAHAWNQVVRRHTVLRTAFVWKGVRQPVQAVHREVQLSLGLEDWRELKVSEQEERWHRLQARDLEEGFELNHAPLLRLKLVRTGERRHRMLLSYPHLLLDGWSLGLVIEEVLTCYEADLQNRTPPLAEVRPFRDFVLWLQEQNTAAAEAYWRHELKGFEEPTRIGLAPARPTNGVMVDRAQAFDPETSKALTALARQHQLTLNTLVQGAWALLLSRYSGRFDVVYGTTTSGRPAGLKGVGQMVGMFINTVPVRVRVPSALPLFEWLTEFQEEQSERLRFEHTPLADIQNWSDVPAGQPLFDTLLVFENYPIPEAADSAGAGPTLALMEAEVAERTNFPLAIGVKPGTQLTVRAFYDRVRLDDAAAWRILGHFRGLLAGLVERPGARLGDLPLLTPVERHQLAVEWNDSAAVHPKEPALHRLFERWVAKAPETEAAVFGTERLTYSELDARAAKLAEELRRLGAGGETLVGLYLERSLALPVAILGVLKSGAAFLPLDPAYPEERVRFMLEDSRAPLIVTTSLLTPRLGSAAAQVVTLDDLELAELAQPTAPGVEVTGENLAYVIYTSGSTGRPKGVQLSHRGLVNLAFAQALSLRTAEPGDRVLQFSPLSFDAAVWETVMALGAGAALVLAQVEHLLPGRGLLELFKEQEIAAATLPPSAASLLPLARLRRLKTLVLAGEACPAELVDRWAGGRRFWNAYGPTETTVCATVQRCAPGGDAPAIGRPIDNIQVHVVDSMLRLLPVGLPGELVIGGAGLARGYLGRPALTAARFVPDPLGAPEPGRRLYRTGDLVRRSSTGEIEFLGRIDHQVKVRGFRIEPEEIELRLREHPQLAEVVVEARGGERLVAWWVAERGSEAPPSSNELREFLESELPGHMVPSLFVRIEEMPLLPNGKIDRAALARRPLPGADKLVTAPRSELEQTIAGIWCEVLGIEHVGMEDNFFELGGHSLAMVRVHGQLEQGLERQIPLVELLWHPTIRALATHLGGGPKIAAGQRGLERAQTRIEAPGGAGVPIAIIGLACRFPGAPDAASFWRNLRDGVESITFFADDELAAAGVPPSLLRDRAYVKAKGFLAGAEEFDNGLFGISPGEAQLLDPQHRLMLECAWEALEDAGLDPRQSRAAIGVFAGAAMNTYWINLATHRGSQRAIDPFQAMLANDKDFLTTRVSYKLDLKGPSIDVQTACSTSLVAIHLAARSLCAGECEVALAGGVSVTSPRKAGYLYREEGIHSPDGHCRAFDAEARGTVVGEGVGLVVLKTLDRALADGDAIRAVLRGSAVNNDGSFKVGFTAPSVEGQADVIAEALAVAGVEPGEISYVETHGSGTALGDPIEVAALHEVFSPRVTQRRSIALGAVKTNIGHTDAAAGIAGLIKTVLALEAAVLPPSLHFARANPKIDFDAGPFFVNTEARPWSANGGPRRAGISAFGLGGTNVHVVAEEAPPRSESSDAGRRYQLLLLSAHTDSALEASCRQLAEHLRHGDEPLADVAFTLHAGRRHLACRRAAVCRDATEATAALTGERPEKLYAGTAGDREPAVIFLFSGLGDQAPGMARGLYESEPELRRELDRAAELLAKPLGGDLREALFPPGCERSSSGAGLDLRRLLGRTSGGGAEDPAARRLAETRLAQPAVFAIELALARLWSRWGIEPKAMIGYSLGEYAAACLAGVIEFDAALLLVAERARLIGELPTGAMLAISLGKVEVQALLGSELALAATHGPQLSVVSGPDAAVRELERELAARGVVSRRIETTHAFHSRMMEPIVEPFRAALGRVRLSPPRIPYVSNVTGTWITAEEATDPEYWIRHLLSTVRFSEGLDLLLDQDEKILLEVGPGQSLATSVRQHPMLAARHTVLASLPDPREPIDDLAFALQTLGRLWLAGVPIAAGDLYKDQQRRRVHLPTYPFERRRFWIEPGKVTTHGPAPPARRSELADWFYVPSWRRGAGLDPAPASGPWLVFTEDSRFYAELADRLGEAVVVCAGTEYRRLDAHAIEIDPTAPGDYDRLLADLEREGRAPHRIAHCWSLGTRSVAPWPADPFDRIQARGFYSLLWLAQALGRQVLPASGLEIVVVAGGLFAVMGEERLCPEAATLLGLCLGLPREMPGVSCRMVEIVPPTGAEDRHLAERLAAELRVRSSESIVALRGRHRWLRHWQAVRCEAGSELPRCLHQRGTYLITGGLGGMGLAIAGYLARHLGARLGLIQRRELPPRKRWGAWLATHGEDDSATRAIRAVQDLEIAGAEVEVISADVADRDQMASAAARLRARFGPIQGIFHTAGVPGGGLIQRQDAERIAAVWAPKVIGTRILAELFDEAEFFVLASSLVSVVGLPDRVEYSAANCFLDAFARSCAGSPGPRTIAINWDSWIGTAMGIAADSAAGDGLTVEEGVEALMRILHRDEPRMAVSTLDLPALIEQTAALEPGQSLGEMRGSGASVPVHPRPQLGKPYTAPRNSAEAALARIWGEVLGLEQVGVHDNFLELGGDSILSLRVIDRARQEGIHLSLAQIFDQPTIAQLADVAGTAAAIDAEQEAVTGDVALTPIQAWFFKRELPERHHWNQSLMLAVSGRLDAAVVRRSLATVLTHHDALRMRFEDGLGGWRQIGEPPMNAPAPIVIDFDRLEIEERASALTSAAGLVQASLDLASSPLVRAACFYLGPESGSRLLLVVHHLIMDAVSWRVLLDDLETVARQAERDKLAELPPKTTSFKSWSERLSSRTAAGGFDEEIEYWLAPERAKASPLPRDLPGGLNTVASRRSVDAALNAEKTRALLQEVPQLYGSEIDDALLSALARTLIRWTGSSPILVDLESHGRDPIFEDVDLSRTIGWFTSLYPFLLALGEDAVDDPGKALLAVQAERARLSYHGLGYGALRYLSPSPELRRRFDDLPEAELSFVFLGQLDQVLAVDSIFAPAAESAGGELSPRGLRSHAIDVTGAVRGGCLRMTWAYSANLHRHDTIERLAADFVRTLGELVDHCRASQEGRYSVSHFPKARLDQSELDQLLDDLEASVAERAP